MGNGLLIACKRNVLKRLFPRVMAMWDSSLSSMDIGLRFGLSFFGSESVSKKYVLTCCFCFAMIILPLPSLHSDRGSGAVEATHDCLP